MHTLIVWNVIAYEKICVFVGAEGWEGENYNLVNVQVDVSNVIVSKGDVEIL